MSDIIDPSCEYLFFSSGYEEILLNPYFHKKLAGISLQKGIIPLGVITLSFLGNFSVKALPIRNEVIDIYASPIDEEKIILDDLYSRLKNNKLLRIGIIFKIRGFQDAMTIATGLKSIGCYSRCNISDIQFLHNEKEPVDKFFLVYVTANAESY